MAASARRLFVSENGTTPWACEQDPTARHDPCENACGLAGFAFDENHMSAVHPLRACSVCQPYAARRVGALFSVLNKIFDVLPELLIGVAVDVVVNQKASFLARAGIVDPVQQLYLLVAITILVWVFESLFEYLYALRWRGLAQDLQHELRNAAYGHLQALPPDTIARERSAGDGAAQRGRPRSSALTPSPTPVQVSFLAAGGCGLFALTTSLAVLALLPVPLILVGAFWFQRRLYPRYAAAREAAATVSARLNNNLAGMATIQAYTAEDFESAHVRAASDAFRARNADAIRFALRSIL